MSKASIVPCALGALFLFSGSALAQPAAPALSPRPVQAPTESAAPLVVDVAQNVGIVDPAALRIAIARELGRPTVAPDAPEASSAHERLTIALDSERRIVMIYRDGQGREVLRRVAMPRNPAAVLAMITLLAGNLARNEAADLARAIAPAQRASTQPPTPREPQPERRVVVEPIVIVATPASTPAVPTTVPQNVRAPAEQGSASDTAAIELAVAPNPLRDQRETGSASDWYDERHGGRFGAYGAIGMALASNTSAWTFHLGVAYRWRHLTLGVDVNHRQVGLAWIQENRWWGSPILTFFTGLGPVRFEAGLGAGLMYLDQFRPLSSPPNTARFLMVAARGVAQVSLALASGLDVFVRGEVALTIPTDVEGGQIALICMGLQTRLFR